MAGRKTRYKKEYDEIAYELCLLGATDDMLSDALGCSVRTINNWKSKHKSFMQSVREGKIVADAKVARSLFEMSVGFTREVEQVVVSNSGPEVMTMSKFFPPNVTAIRMWLHNRQGALWNGEGMGDGEHTVTINMMGFDGAAPDAA